MPSPAVSLKHLRTLWILLSAALILASCSSPEPVPSPQPPLPSPSPEGGQTITLITPDAANIDSSKTSKYQIQTRLTDFELLSETEGLAWGVTRNALRLYMTKDNGKTWTNISPSQTVQFSSIPVYGQDIYFTDTHNGWIIRQAFDMMETVVLRTRDGGQTWKISSLNQGSNIKSIAFASPQKGWLMATWDSDNTSESKALYQTDDGGATWKTVMQNDQYSPELPHPAIPVSGVTGGMVFRDINHGMITLNQGNAPRLFHTFDGGEVWHEDKSFGQNSAFQAYETVQVGKPEFFSLEEGWIPAASRKKGTDGTIYGGYFTANGGSNWKYVTFDLGMQSGVNEKVAPTFLDTRKGWMLKGNLMYRTTDQGQTWSSLPSSTVLKDKLSEYPEIVKLQFVSEEVGWLLIGKSDEKRSILLRTTNGGYTWSVL